MRTKYLLDTCAAIWIGNNEEGIAPAAIAALNESEKGEVYVSPITAWEIGLLVARGRLPKVVDAGEWFGDLLDKHASLTELSPAILIGSSFLPGNLHGDPADRIIIATARSYELTIITRDRRILDYANDGHVLALAC